MSNDPQALIVQLAQRRTEWLAARLAELAPGETLCVHDEPFGGDFAPDRDVYAFTMRATVHRTTNGDTCDTQTRRTQYGPAPADWVKLVSEHTGREVIDS